MFDHHIAVPPTVFPLLGLYIGPGKILDDPGGSHLPHHPQRTLNLPRLDLVGETSVDADQGVRGDHLLRRAQDDQDVGRADSPQDKERQGHPDEMSQPDTAQLGDAVSQEGTQSR
jgi:hypothetical protein